MAEDMICPECSSALIVRLGNSNHCNECGLDFALDKNPISTRAADRKAQAGPSTGFVAHRHANDGMEEIEQAIIDAESALRAASRDVLAAKSQDPELPRLRQVERDARAAKDKLLRIRGERAAAAQK